MLSIVHHQWSRAVHRTRNWACVLPPFVGVQREVLVNMAFGPAPPVLSVV